MLYSYTMIRTRRVLSFSSKVYTHLLLFNLFFYALFLIRLWFPVTPLFGEITENILFSLTTIGLLYGLYLLLLIIFLLFQDHIFLLSQFLITIGKIVVFVGLLLSAQLITTVTQQGFYLTL
jgi:hypothetical protein